VKQKLGIAALCMAPTTLAKALEDEGITATLTVGSTSSKSPYDIAAISQGMEKVGARPEFCDVNGVMIDAKNKIVTSPCYMMEASISQVHLGIKRTVEALLGLIKK
ncbi:MAG: isoprenoid biosynthesis protein ElbB, partial [Cytophagales bacterium]